MPQPEPVDRPGARVVLLNGRGEVLLFRIETPPAFWLLPGGALEPGESFEDAARRELVEETGVSGDLVGPCVWTGESLWSLHGRDIFSRERYFLARAPGVPSIDCSGMGGLEQDIVDGHRWWSMEALRRSTDEFSPPELPALAPALVRGAAPRAPVQLAFFDHRRGLGWQTLDDAAV